MNKLPAFDPRPYFPAVTAGYALREGTPLPLEINLVDVLMGPDLSTDSTLTPQAAVVQEADGSFTIGFAGTTDWRQWVANVEILSASTSLGSIAFGLWKTFYGLVCKSGAPLSKYVAARVRGHSRGASLAAVWAIQNSSLDWDLFEVPKLIGAPGVARLIALQLAAGGRGQVFAEAGDVVPFVPLFGYPDMPAAFHLLPPGSGDLAYHHEWTTVMASIEALYPASV